MLVKWGGSWDAWDALTDETVTVETKNGILDVRTDDNGIGRALYSRGFCEYHKVDLFLSLLRGWGLLPARGTGTVVDVGAHIGEIVIGLLVNGEFENAIAIEPEPLNFSMLKRNLEHNQLSSRVVLHECAVSDRVASEVLEINPTNRGDNRVRKGYVTDAWPTVPVKVNTLDNLLEGREVSLIWMDVQGFEGLAIKGGAGVFSSGVPVIMEVWPGGILYSGMGLDEYITIVEEHFGSFCGRDGTTLQPISQFGDFVREIPQGTFSDAILTREEVCS